METLLPFEKIKRDIFIRKRSKTDKKFGKKPEERTVKELLGFGVVNFNKPRGPTSHQIVDYVKKILKIDKGGHSGTLDPKVTGVLPVALGRGTRIVQTLLTAGKEYVCIMHLHKEVEEEKIRKAMNSFVGRIKQLPPIKSSVKRVHRYRKIYYIEILEIKGKDVLFRVGSQAGTYIRKLCLHPNTEIITKDGLVKAESFYQNPRLVYTKKGAGIKSSGPSSVQKIKSPQRLVKISLSSGLSLIVTPDHKMLASSEDGYAMVESDKLRAGAYLVKTLNPPAFSKDYVISDLLDDNCLIPDDIIRDKCKTALIRKYGSIRSMHRKLGIDRKLFLSKSKIAVRLRYLKLAGIYNSVKKDVSQFKTEKGKVIRFRNLNSKFLYLLGLVASDGNNTKEKNTVRHTRIKFHNNNEYLVDKFVFSYKSLFPNIPISKRKIRGNLFQLDTSNSFFAEIAASLGVKSPHKDSDILPILYLKPGLLKSFLRGYFDGDGTCYFKKKRFSPGNHIAVRCFSVSYTNAKRIHQMLLKIGIPNTIFNKQGYYVISINSISGMHKFINEVGTNHPSKQKIFSKILCIPSGADPADLNYVPFHFKRYLFKNKKKLAKLGGNLSRVLRSDTPITRRLYKKASSFVSLPPLDQFVVEKIRSIERVKGIDHVYDMTVPRTHNFLIETGFVSSNCHDIGEKLKVGAHMAELIRTKAGPFQEKEMVTLQDVEDALWFYKNENNEKYIRHCIKPIEKAVEHLPKVWVFDTTVEPVCHGSDLAVPGISKLESDIQLDETVAIMTLKDELVAIGPAKMISKDMQNKEKGIAVKTSKVFMLPGTYPRVKNK